MAVAASALLGAETFCMKVSRDMILNAETNRITVYKPTVRFLLVLIILACTLWSAQPLSCSERLQDTGENTYFWPNNLLIDERYPMGLSGMEDLLMIKRDRPFFRHNIFQTPALGALFFSDMYELRKFEAGNAGKSNFRYIAPFHVVRAEHDIGPESAGGKIFDPDIGAGVALFIPSNGALSIIKGPSFHITFPHPHQFRANRTHKFQSR